MTMIPDSHRDLLTGEVVLATLGPDSQPQVTAIVSRLADDGTIEFSLNSSRQKLKNIQKNPRVTVFRADPETPMRTIEVRAKAALFSDPGKVWSQEFGKQFGFDMDSFDGPDDLRIKVVLTPEAVNVLPPAGH
ncbi:MAG: pyridoxamine 5'-phosphate oxidase family protein [Ilumatobacteraceae bacterium]|nr:pyridoxamine 5'-phosphate oxidase family protein [Ilumatobacteraceae bacterium]